jgi:hypothetical protein
MSGSRRSAVTLKIQTTLFGSDLRYDHSNRGDHDVYLSHEISDSPNVTGHPLGHDFELNGSRPSGTSRPQEDPERSGQLGNTPPYGKLRNIPYGKLRNSSGSIQIKRACCASYRISVRSGQRVPRQWFFLILAAELTSQGYCSRRSLSSAHPNDHGTLHGLPVGYYLRWPATNRSAVRPAQRCDQRRCRNVVFMSRFSSTRRRSI